MKKVEYVQNALGFTQNEVLKIVDIQPDELKMHEMELEKIPWEKVIILESLVTYSKLAASKSQDLYKPGSNAAKHKSIAAQLVHNEAQQKTVVTKISDRKSSYNQQLNRWSLLEYLAIDKRLANLPWAKALKSVLGKKSMPGFDNELYQNEIKLKLLKYERKLLEQELQLLLEYGSEI